MQLNIRIISFGLFLFCFFPLKTFGQRDMKEAVNSPYIGIQYGLNRTGGDLAERYGLTNAIGLYAGYKIKKNWVFGFDGNYFFGKDIRIDGVLQNIKDKNGYITNTSGGEAIVLMFNRGFNGNLSIGKIFPVFKSNPNSGIMIQIGGGFFIHKLRIESHQDEVPQISGDYLKGYDRLTAGTNLTGFLGYNFMANRGIVNFYAGFYFQQGFTKNRRDIFWDHPNERVSKDLRLENLTGFRVGWIVPIYKQDTKDYYFN